MASSVETAISSLSCLIQCKPTAGLYPTFLVQFYGLFYLEQFNFNADLEPAYSDVSKHSIACGIY